MEFSSKIEKGICLVVGFEWNQGSLGYGKQCALVFSCAEEGG